MEGRVLGNTAVLRVDKGEDIIESVTTFIIDNDIKSASVTGIGASNNIEIGIFIPSEKKYYRKSFTEDYEITNITGNVTEKDGEKYLHLHISFSDRDLNLYGGHLFKAIISAACEIYFTISEIEVNREFVEETGLNILKFS